MKSTKAAWGILSLIYGGTIVLLHDTFVKVSIVVMNYFSLDTYNIIVRNIAVAIGVGLFLSLVYFSSKHSERLKLFSYIIITTALIIIHALFLFEMNIEIIHAAEYGLLSLLLYKTFNRFGAAVVFALPVMVFDEYYQYAILYPSYTKYFEFNDIVMDIIGCGFAMILVKSVVDKKEKITIWYRRHEMIFLFAVAFVFVALLASCVISSHNTYTCGNTIFSLSRIENPETFWHTHSFTKATYHILKPIEGFIIVMLLCLFFIGLDGYSSTARTSPSKMV